MAPALVCAAFETVPGVSTAFLNAALLDQLDEIFEEVIRRRSVHETATPPGTLWTKCVGLSSPAVSRAMLRRESEPNVQKFEEFFEMREAFCRETDKLVAVDHDDLILVARVFVTEVELEETCIGGAEVRPPPAPSLPPSDIYGSSF
eukprot:379206-Hanusia_phi.AAC.2